MKYSFGIDVGGTSIKCGLFTENGELTEDWSIPTRLGENGRFIYDDVAAAVKEKLTARGIPMEDCMGLGVDMPGTILKDGYLDFANNLHVHDSYPAKELSGRLGGLKAAAANDANAAGFGELWMGAGKGYRSMCMVTLGTGVGGAVIDDGEIICGFHGAGGEIGHICVNPEEKESCNCGARGCVEFYASATGIVRVARRMLQSGDYKTPVKEGVALLHPESRLAGFGDRLTAKDVCDMAKDGDALAGQVLDISMDALGRALSTVTLVTDPEVFVIGGGVAAAGEILLDRIRRSLAAYTPILRDAERKVVIAKLGNKAGIYGAAALVSLNAR